MAAQLPDIILIHDKPMDLYSNPLENYWKSSNKKRPAFRTTESCKRGYIATWEVHNEQLFLTSMEGDVEKNSLFFGRKFQKYTLKQLFSKSKMKPVKANWFSGKLRIPLGNMTLYEHSDYNSRFEKEIIITVSKGEVIKVVTLDYTHQKLVVNMEHSL